MLQVVVCIGSSCYLKGAWQVVQVLQNAIAEHHVESLVELKAGFCCHRCRQGVVVEVGGRTISGVKPEDALSTVFLAAILPEVKAFAGTSR